MPEFTRLQTQTQDTCIQPWWLTARELSCTPGITVVIPACNEQAVIAETLDWLGRNLCAADRVHVIADNCQDDTARIACRHGAIVHVRNDEASRGKGAALSWWLEQTQSGSDAEEYLLILDADSQIAPDMIAQIRSVLQAGTKVVQVRIAPLIASQNPIARLAGLSEVVELRVRDAFRARRGWPVRLRGTGMVLQREIMARFSVQLQSYVEDLELTLLLADAGIHIAYLDDTYVADPKPANTDGVQQQRARWLRGQIEVMFRYAGMIARLLLKGPPAWSLLSSMFLKPKTIFLTIRCMFSLLSTALAIQHGGGVWGLVSAWLNLSLLWELGLHLYCLRYVPDRRQMLLALLQAPGYLLMWLRSMLLSLAAGKTWLRGRPM